MHQISVSENKRKAWSVGFAHLAIFVVSAFGATTAFGSPLFIASTNAASGWTQVPGVTDTKSYSDLTPGGVASSSSIAYAAGSADVMGSSNSMAWAGLGAVHAASFAEARATAPNCCISGAGSTSAYAEYNDGFVAHSNSFADGTVVTLTANVLIHGAAGTNGSPNVPYNGAVYWSGQSWWRTTERVGNQFWENSSSSHGASWYDSYSTGNGNFGLLTLTTDIILGQLTNVVLRAETSASTTASSFDGTTSYSFSSADLGNTVSWGGITSLTRKSDGAVIGDFTAISSDTGFNFAQAAVPVPAAAWLLGSGLIGLAGFARKSKPA